MDIFPARTRHHANFMSILRVAEHLTQCMQTRMYGVIPKYVQSALIEASISVVTRSDLKWNGGSIQFVHKTNSFIQTLHYECRHVSGIFWLWSHNAVSHIERGIFWNLF